MKSGSILIEDLEVWYHIGVPDSERESMQLLLLSLEMRTDFEAAAADDDVTQTINYFEVCQRLLKLGEGKSWKLLETLSEEIAELVLEEFGAKSVVVQIKKFIIPQTKFVGVRIERSR